MDKRCRKCLVPGELKQKLQVIWTCSFCELDSCSRQARYEQRKHSPYGKGLGGPSSNFAIENLLRIRTWLGSVQRLDNDTTETSLVCKH